MTLRLILGDQLHYGHSWYGTGPDPDTLYVMMEMRQETDYAQHHIQKVIAFFAAMRQMAAWLEEQGHRVLYLNLDDTRNAQTLEGNLAWIAAEHRATRLEYQLPDEYRLDQMLQGMATRLGLAGQAYDTEHFLAGREEVQRQFAGKRTYLMESFYRAQRMRYGILMEGPRTPEGGQWNYDQDNRAALPARHDVPAPYVVEKDYRALEDMICKAGVQTMGTVDAAHFIWPTSRAECLAILEHFATEALPNFGRYEDAMASRAWLVYHSRLSFAMNSKQLSPAEVVDRALAEYRARPAEISLAQIEGFVRQIVGWREYMRGIYWAQMPGFATLNFFGNTRPLPGWFYTGQTRMNCLSHALGQSLDRAYAHHIQRLMIIGNWALLMGADPASVDAWYLGVYIDAIEWVEITNVRGMSQFADGGIVGTKPYAASAAYINRMSDYCKGCAYDFRRKTGEGACPFNSLYWHFHARHRARLEANPRIGMVYKNWDRMDAQVKAQTLAQAEVYLEKVEEL